MTLFELQAWLGHGSPNSTQQYAKISPATLTKAYQDAGYFERNVRTVEVLIDRDAVQNGTAATGEPWLSAALGHPVEYRQISPAEHRAAMIAAGIPEAVATSNAQAFGLIAEGDAAWLSDDVESITGTAPRPLRAFIADHVQALYMIP